jgi:hypothetical protein
VPVAVVDDLRGQALRHARHPAQQRRRGGVDVDADRVHAVLHDRVERAGQRGLGEVVLVLPDPDRLGVDLDQLGERVLQPRAMETAPRSDTSRSGSSAEA